MHAGKILGSPGLLKASWHSTSIEAVIIALQSLSLSCQMHHHHRQLSPQAGIHRHQQSVLSACGQLHMATKNSGQTRKVFLVALLYSGSLHRTLMSDFAVCDVLKNYTSYVNHPGIVWSQMLIAVMQVMIWTGTIIVAGLILYPLMATARRRGGSHKIVLCKAAPAWACTWRYSCSLQFVKAHPDTVMQLCMEPMQRQ